MRRLPVGTLYELGDGVSKDLRRAIDLLRGSGSRFRHSTISAWSALSSGQGVEANNATALAWTKKATDQGMMLRDTR